MDLKKTVLANGLRVLVYPMRGVESVTVMLLWGVGSRYEERSKRGICHMLEHMAFKSTSDRSSEKILAEIESLGGGMFRAFTSKECTGYYIKTSGAHLSSALEILADVSLNPLFLREELKREKGSVFQEINEYLDDPMESAEDAFEALLYGDQPMGWGILGTKEAISKLKPLDLRRFKERWEKPRNLVLAVAGDVEEEGRIFALAERLFGGLADVPVEREFAPAVIRQSRPRVRIYPRKIIQANFVLGVESFSYGHALSYPADLLAAVLGRGKSSRIYQQLVDRRGLVYTVLSENYSYFDTGNLYVRSKAEEIDEALRLVIEEFNRIRAELVEEPELARAKEVLIGQLKYGAIEEEEEGLTFENSRFMAEHLATQELLEGGVISLEEYFAKIRAVTAEQVLQAAKQIFRPNRLNLVVVGPYYKRKDRKRFLEILSKLKR